jgi:helix-hairpin-helix protein
VEPNGNRRELRARLEGALRGLRLIDQTTDRESRRVMLGCLVKDFRKIEHLASVAPLAVEEAGLLGELQSGAARVKSRTGAPIEPDDPGRTRTRKGAKDGTPRRRRSSAVLPGNDQPGGEPPDRATPPGPVPELRGDVEDGEAGTARGPECVRRGARPVRRTAARKRGRPLARFRHFRQRHPETRFWLTAGLVPKAALALAKAGFRSLADLEGVRWADLLAIQGVGRFSLATIEELLGQPLPGSPTSPNLSRPWQEVIWRKRGLQVEAAITFAQEGMTLVRLQSMTREDLLSLRGVGVGTIQACELILGREIPSRKPPRKKVEPPVAFWRRQGLYPRAARALSEAGIGSLEALQGRYREELLALRGLGEFALRQLEALLGSAIPSRTAYWIERGLPMGAANVLAREGIETLEDLGQLSREQLLSFVGLGYRALRECERLLGRMLPFDRR